MKILLFLFMFRLFVFFQAFFFAFYLCLKALSHVIRDHNGSGIVWGCQYPYSYPFGRGHPITNPYLNGYGFGIPQKNIDAHSFPLSPLFFFIFYHCIYQKKKHTLTIQFQTNIMDNILKYFKTINFEIKNHYK